MPRKCVDHRDIKPENVMLRIVIWLILGFWWKPRLPEPKEAICLYDRNCGCLRSRRCRDGRCSYHCQVFCECDRHPDADELIQRAIARVES